MSGSLATNADAQIILELYKLRTEARMREARFWLMYTFWPASADDVLALFAELGSEHNQYIRQVTTYWEMAAGFVLHGALSAELFLDSSTEPFFLYAKFVDMLPAIRQHRPQFLTRTGALVDRYPDAHAHVERLRKGFVVRQKPSGEHQQER